MTRVAFSAQLRREVEATFGRNCWLCQASIADSERISLDHVVPVQHSGTNDLVNLRPAHTRCNTMRSDWDVASHYAWAMSGRPEWVYLVPAVLRQTVLVDAAEVCRNATAHYTRGTGPKLPLGGSWAFRPTDRDVHGPHLRQAATGPAAAGLPPACALSNRRPQARWAPAGT